MKKSAKTVLITVLAAACVLGTVNASADKDKANTEHPKITLQQARKLALKAFPGKILNEELEKEAGGSGLRYSFDIRQGKKVHEIGIDANTGKLLENSDDSQDSD